MKKAFVIAAILLSTGLTALSITNKNSNHPLKTDRSAPAKTISTIAPINILATAD